jgi:hypothetical protein
VSSAGLDRGFGTADDRSKLIDARAVKAEKARRTTHKIGLVVRDPKKISSSYEKPLKDHLEGLNYEVILIDDRFVKRSTYDGKNSWKTLDVVITSIMCEWNRYPVPVGIIASEVPVLNLNLGWVDDFGCDTYKGFQGPLITGFLQDNTHPITDSFSALGAYPMYTMSLDAWYFGIMAGNDLLMTLTPVAFNALVVSQGGAAKYVNNGFYRVRRWSSDAWTIFDESVSWLLQ